MKIKKRETLSLFFFVFFYLAFQSTSIYSGDAGDLVTSAYLGGVAHPPGYPLYTLLGHLLTKLPLYTVAWRVGLLSSLSTALILFSLYMFISKITKDRLISIIAVCTLDLTYLYWLYSSVPEVFALNSLFSIVLIYVLYLWSQKKDIRLFYLFFFVFGLSLTHHHIILFLVPAFIYQIYIHRGLLPTTKKYIFSCFLMFTVGLLSYLYVVFAAHFKPAINWENPSNLQGLINLITRYGYGSFQTGTLYGQNLLTRLLVVRGYFEFILTDFGWLVCLIALAGALYQLKKSRNLFTFLFIAFIFSGPLFFFYASYLFFNNFMIATAERFLHPSYLFITIWFAEGLLLTKIIVERLFDKLNFPKSRHIIYSSLIVATFFVIPASLFYINYSKISILKNDRTGENLGIDILNTPEKNSILILSRDNELFNSQYVHFAQGIRGDIKLIHSLYLDLPTMHSTLKKNYPMLFFPDERSADYITDFIKTNSNKFPIYTNQPIQVNVNKASWVRYGLLYKFFQKGQTPNDQEIYSINSTLWKKYHNPLSGSLAKYKNLMLSNIIDVYSLARLDMGFIALQTGRNSQAISEYNEAIKLTPRDDRPYYYLFQIYLNEDKCDLAERNILKTIELNKSDKYYEATIGMYKKCKNIDRAIYFEEILKRRQHDRETPIEKI